MVMFCDDAAQGGLEIDQVKTLCPTVNPVMVVVGESEFVITPLPETRIHVPTPAVGVLAVIATLPVLTQTVLLPPALAMDGTALVVMVMLDVDEAHGA